MGENLHNDFDDFLRDKLGGEPPPNSAFSAGRRETDAEWAKVTQRLDSIQPVHVPAPSPSILRYLYPAAAAAALAISGLLYMFHENNLKIEALRNEVLANRVRKDTVYEKIIIYKEAGRDAEKKEADGGILDETKIRDAEKLAKKDAARLKSKPVPASSNNAAPPQIAALPEQQKEKSFKNSGQKKSANFARQAGYDARMAAPGASLRSKGALPKADAKDADSAALNTSDFAASTQPDAIKQGGRGVIASDAGSAPNSSGSVNTSENSKRENIAAVPAPTPASVEVAGGVPQIRLFGKAELAALSIRKASEIRQQKIAFDQDLMIPVVRRRKSFYPLSIAGVRLSAVGDLTTWNNFIYKNETVLGAAASAEMLIGKKIGFTVGLGYGQKDFTREEMDLDQFRPDDHPKDMKPGHLAGTWKYMNYDAGIRYYASAVRKFLPFAGAGFNWQKGLTTVVKVNFFDIHDHDHQLGPPMDKLVDNEAAKTFIHFNAGALYPLSSRFALQGEAVYGKRIDSGAPELSNYFGMNLKATLDF